MKDTGKGKANSTSGIPLPGATTQLQTGSVEPNREESITAFNHIGKEEEFGKGYFEAEEDRLGQNDGSFIGTKDDEKWAEGGLQDEANLEEDDDWDEGTYPEIQPLHLVEQAPSVPDRPDEFAEIELQPDDVEGAA